MDHGKGDGKRPIVHLLIEDVLIVNNDSEGEEDPDGDIAVGEKDLLQNTVAERSTLAHCGQLRGKGEGGWWAGGLSKEEK